jgi:hypothetical protein
VNVLDVGAAWAAVPDGSGAVRGSFSKAVHLDVGGVLLVVVGPTVPPGPLHLRVEQLPGVADGTPAAVSAGRLTLGPFAADVARAPRWTAPAVARLLPATTIPGAQRSALAGERELLAGVIALIARGDLDALAARLGGRGPGLTPAGDDVLAGIVLTLHARGFDEARLRRAVEAVRTTDLARAYLLWCARGQCIAPAHDVLRAVAHRDAGALAEAAARLAGLGASSGTDLLLGLQLALAAVPQNGRSASHTALIAS